MPSLGQRDFLVNQALLSTKAKSQRRIIPHSSSSHYKTMGPVHQPEPVREKEVAKRLSQVETVKALRDVFGRGKAEERRPATNHIMERYSKKRMQKPKTLG